MLLVELEGRSNLAAPFGVAALRYDEVELGRWPGGGRLRARQITPEWALEDYLDSSGLSMITNRLARTGAVDVVATAAPGIRDLLALGKIRQLEQSGVAELIVVDAPAAGHAVSFLRAPAGLAASAASGPVRRQADEVLAMFADERRCRVQLVTTPEEAPVTEVIETAFDLEDTVGISLGPVVVNGRWAPVPGLVEAVANAPQSQSQGPAVAAARYRLGRVAADTAEIERLRAELPLAQVVLPFLFTTDVGRSHIDDLAAVLTAELDALDMAGEAR